MPQTTFAYKVRDSSGKVLEGTLEADNTSLVASRLRQMGYTPVNIEARSRQRSQEGTPPARHGAPVCHSKNWPFSAASSPP